MTYIIFTIFDNLFDLFQVTLSKMAKHWDSFLSDCMPIITSSIACKLPTACARRCDLPLPMIGMMGASGPLNLVLGAASMSAISTCLHLPPSCTYKDKLPDCLLWECVCVYLWCERGMWATWTTLRWGVMTQTVRGPCGFNSMAGDLWRT